MARFYSISKGILMIFLCVLTTFSISAQAINFDLSIDKDILKPGNTEVQFEYNLTNTSTYTFDKIDFESNLYIWRTQALESDLGQDLTQFDPNNNGLLEPGETWTLRLYQNIFANTGETYVLNGGVQVQTADGQVFSAGDAQMIHIYGVNMDVTILNECVDVGDKIDITLTTRLLIDEDAAKNPGVTIITVGGMDIIIPLPASQWEARDLMMSATNLNMGNVFDPFNPPAGIDLENFCEQGGVDAGRNAADVLDECEPIETVRFPCTMMGEDDVLCEFPDWEFCYCIQTPTDEAEWLEFTVSTPTIDASDDFTIWKADENPAGSGMYGDFIDVTDQVESGGMDGEAINYKIIPVKLVDFTVQEAGNGVQLSWATESEINNKHFEILRSRDGIQFDRIGVIEGQGTSQARIDYRFMDKTPSLGLNYYQLMQVDFDGATDYSSIAQIDLNYKSGSANVEIRPNPVSDFLSIDAGEIIGQVSIVIFDERGSVVKEATLGQGEQLDVTDMLNGVYFAKVFDQYNYEIGSQRIMIAK